MNLNAERGRATLSYSGRPGPQGPTGPPGVAGGGGCLELEFSAADLAGGLPMLIGSVPDASLIRAAVVRFSEYFDEPTLLKIGQDALKKRVYTSAAPQDDEGYKAEIYDKFSGGIYLYPEFQTAPATGAGVIYVAY